MPGAQGAGPPEKLLSGNEFEHSQKAAHRGGGRGTVPLAGGWEPLAHIYLCIPEVGIAERTLQNSVFTSCETLGLE